MSFMILIVLGSGKCPDGEYLSGSNCTDSPAGYYKPSVAFSDNYYICGEGTYSSSGASACTSCGNPSATFGATACLVPTLAPTAHPIYPSSMPTSTPTPVPTARPTAQPSKKPTPSPTSIPTPAPTADPTTEPSATPTAEPTAEPSADPTTEPTAEPTAEPSAGPTRMPSASPTVIPTRKPSSRPTTATPTLLPTPSFGLMGFDYGKSTALTASDFDCMVDYNFDFFVQRAYVTWHTTRHGIENSIDPNLCTHLRLAYKAGLDIKGVYVQPRPRYGISYAAVVTSLKRELANNCSAFADVPVFLSVLSNNYVNNGWRDSYLQNRKWLEGYLILCKKYFHSCGVLSSQTVWTSVFNDAGYTNHSVFEGVSVWYSSDESKPNFKDFRDGSESFGGWTTPVMKQFESRQLGLCDMITGLDWSLDN
jgi:hypothetical protein